MTTGAPQADPGPTTEGAAKPKSRWRRFLERWWASPNPDLVDAGLRGELLIAGIRLLIVTLLLYFPLNQYWHAPRAGTSRLLLWVAAGALAEALVIYSAVVRSWGRRWIGFFSGILDVTLVTLSLWIFFLLDRPLEAISDLVIFPAYFLAIGATSLRYDFRICWLTGFAAMIQYLAVVAFAAWRWELWRVVDSESSTRAFSWQLQVGRLGLLLVATLLAATIVKRAHDQRKLSTRDRLTDLANRGFFDESLARMGALAERSGQPVTLAMIDVDHFKRFNDTYGHQAGDQALCAVAAMLNRSFRTTDLVARYGGEEFVGLFPGMDLTDASRRLEQLRAELEKMPIPLEHGRNTQVTVSIGAAVWPQDGVNLKETLKIADMRLYRAKGAGRNRVVASRDRSEDGEPS